MPGALLQSQLQKPLRNVSPFCAYVRGHFRKCATRRKHQECLLQGIGCIPGVICRSCCVLAWLIPPLKSLNEGSGFDGSRGQVGPYSLGVLGLKKSPSAIRKRKERQCLPVLPHKSSQASGRARGRGPRVLAPG